jgi:hypothetical protein
MVMPDLRLALLSLCSLWGFEGCDTKCVGLVELSLSCAYALEPACTSRKRKQSLHGISSFSLGQYGPIPSSMSRSSNNDNSNCEIVYRMRVAAESCPSLESASMQNVTITKTKSGKVPGE